MKKVIDGDNMVLLEKFHAEQTRDDNGDITVYRQF